MATKKAAEAAFRKRPQLALRNRSLLGAEMRELVAEFFDAATQRVDALLGSGVERMRLAGRFQLEQWHFAAVVQLDRLFAGGTRPCHELETIG